MKPMPTGPEPRYTDEQAEAILRLATKLKPGGTLASADLVRMGAELGISSDDIRAAEREYRAHERDRQDAERFHRERVQGFVAHLIPFVLVNGFLMFLSLSQGKMWFLGPLLGWGIGLFFHCLGTFNKSDRDYQKEFRKWQRERHRENRPARYERDDDDEEEDDDDDDDAERASERRRRRLNA